MRSALAIAKALRFFLVPADTVPTPTIATCTPSSVSSAGGTVITVKGTGFLYGGASTVEALFFGLVAAPSFTVVDKTTITVAAPAHAPGPTTLILYSSGGTAMKGNAVTFT